MDVQSMTIARVIEEAAEKSQAALRPTFRVLNGWDDDIEVARGLFERLVERYGKPGGFRSTINDYVPGEYFVSLTECPYAYIALEAASLGIPDVKRLLLDDDDDEEGRASSEAMLSGVRL